jgi:pilus assembly protein CpaC
LLTVLAEPNLVAMSGQHASFLAGGEVAIPVPQVSGGTTTGITVMFKNFGVALDFLPFVMEDESVRLTVSPEVSQLNYANGTELAGTKVPGFDTRKTTTTVEMRQGQTLAIAGLLQVEINADTRKVPGLGDIPYLGTFFSNTTHKRVEKELLVLVTPYLVAPMDPDQVPALPGAGIKEPTDLEFYLLNRIEGRTGRDFNTTQNSDDPLHLVRLLRMEQKNVCGPVGFSSSD